MRACLPVPAASMLLVACEPQAPRPAARRAAVYPGWRFYQRGRVIKEYSGAEPAEQP